MSADRPAPPKSRRSNEAPITRSGEIDVPDAKTIPGEFGIDLEGFDEAMEDELTHEKDDPDVALVVAHLPKDDDTPVVPIKAAPPPPGPPAGDDEWNLPPTTVSPPPRRPAPESPRPGMLAPKTTVYGYPPQYENRSVFGTVGGAVIGALIGSQVAHPEHRAAATAAGAVIGGVIGNGL